MESEPYMDGHKLKVASSTNKSFLRSIIERDNRDQDKPEGPKGAIGLTTLHNPDKVVVDLIFVHGLMGGSQSTWTKNGDMSLFWPQKWLPKDKAFRDVRIHTFGYAADVIHGSAVNIPDFAGSLLSSIHDSPSINPRENVPLIFIGHSMGGLVIKKAFIIGHSIPVYQPLVKRVCGIFFLATPHQGAHLAQTLSRILDIAPGSRQFLHDISPASPVLESINEEFPRYSIKLELFSFFENKKMNYYLGRNFIVKKQNAVMNYKNERRIYLQANHRDVARFSSPNDSSYIAIRNSLATYIEEKRRSKESERQLVGHDQLAALNKFLEISEAPERLMTLESIRLPGSCEWLPQKDYFQRWRDAACSQVLWLRGRPGAGKSVLCSHVINHLRDTERDCCFFFFTDGDNQKATINSFLRSIAWQMAMAHPEILLRVLEISATRQDRAISKVDYDLIWSQLYLQGILKVQLNRPQYWVIDSLDECKGGSNLVNLLAKVQERWPLYLLITSRNPVSVYINSTNPRIEIVSETILDEETNKDISLFLKANLDSLPARSLSGRKAIANQILHTSSGCFLWVNLILNELRQVTTSAEIKKVLDGSPEKMDSLYLKILTDMTAAKFGRALAKTILTWTTFSFRPLSTEELNTAIELDTKGNINDIEKSISTCCGNLVYIDSRKKVQLIHLTLRDFLTRQDIASEFSIERASGHKRLALVCLQYLSSKEMRAPRPKKFSVLLEGQVKSPFANYACKFLFQHLVYIKSYDDEVFIALSKFLASTNALSWIEHLATISELQQVFQAGKTINNLLNRRSQHTPPLGLRKELSLLERWGNDLIHLVTKFGKQLSLFPSSIHHLIAPFCPLDSALKQQFASPYRGLSVHGLSETAWNDCLSIINYLKPVTPKTVATSAGIFALGMSTGSIIIYNDITCQEFQILHNGEPVLCLTFGETGKYLASSGGRLVRVWDTASWSELFKFSTPDICIALTFIEEDSLLLGAIKNNRLMYWDMANSGTLHDDPINWMSDLEGDPSWRSMRPIMASFNPYQKLLAIIYLDKDIVLWDYERDCIYDIYEKKSGSRSRASTTTPGGITCVLSLAFNRTLLAAAYTDGDVVIYDTISGEVRGFLTAVNSQTLSFSLDGRTLASANSHGTIQLFDLDPLKVIYRLQSDDNGIGPGALAFTSDSYRVIDIRKYQCLVWEPVALLRQDLDDENSDTVSVSTAPQEIDYKVLGSICITAITCVQSAPIVFCGKEDGSVHVYDISSEPQGQQLFVQTPEASILLLYFDVEKGILTCSDSSSRVVSREVIRKQLTGWETRDPLADIRARTNVTNILTSGKHSRLLVSAGGQDTLWQIPKNTEETHLVQLESKEKRHWVQNTTNPDQLILITASEAKIYYWPTLTYLSSVLLANLALPPMAVDRFIPLHSSQFFATVAKDLSQISSQSVIQIWDCRNFNLNSNSASSVYNLGTLSSTVKAVIGVFSDRLIFLNNDYWICSIDLDSVEETTVRHLFIPNDWVSSVNRLILDVGQNGEILFVKRAELAVIKRGLKITEKGTFNPPRKRRIIPMPA